MSSSLLKDAFGHHIWATTRMIDVCLMLNQEQQGTIFPGTYGSIIETQRHLVGSDAWYLFCITGDRTLLIDEVRTDLRGLRSAMELTGAAWTRLLEQDLDPDDLIREVDDDDGYEKHAPLGIRLAQALHHGSDHRSQIATTLTMLGLEPPAIDAWDFGLEDGRVVEVPPTA